MIIPTSNADCLLRPLREGDQEDIVLHGNNRKIWRNLTHIFPHPYTLADADQWVVSSNSDPRSLHLAIELQGQVVGMVGAQAGTGISESTADFGYWLGEPFWGQGWTTLAVSAFKQHVVQSSRFVRLQATVFAWNPASMRVLEKNGFSRDGMCQ